MFLNHIRPIYYAPIETSELIWNENQLTGFNMNEVLTCVC